MFNMTNIYNILKINFTLDDAQKHECDRNSSAEITKEKRIDEDEQNVKGSAYLYSFPC